LRKIRFHVELDGHADAIEALRWRLGVAKHADARLGEAAGAGDEDAYTLQGVHEIGDNPLRHVEADYRARAEPSGVSQKLR
jgi:hypothetical protein